MKPYYQDDYVTIYHGDCRELLPNLAVSVVVTDPPYGMNAKFQREGMRCKSSLASAGDYSRNWDAITGDSEPFNPSHLLNYRVVALSGANHYAAQLPSSSKWLIWDKRAGSRPDNNSDAELWWTNQTGAARIYYQKWRGVVREGVENVANSRKMHPAQKPIALMKWIIKQLPILEQDVICDPYCGSGTTLRAAKDLGLRSIGIEIEEKYCEIAAERLRQEVFSF